MVKINGLFLDYDGTLSPLNVSRHDSKVPPHLEAILNVICKSMKIGIITTKDLPFIIPRTPFASAWSAIAGIEMKVGSQYYVTEVLDYNLPQLLEALIYAKQKIQPGLVIEEKCDFRGLPMAFCVDWRQIKNVKEAKSKYSPILAYCKRLPLKIIEYTDKPYFDVYYSTIDKGQALKRMKDKLGISDGTLYMGDSITDNAAFKAADISIGVTESTRPDDLLCRYWIKFCDVAYFFSVLLKNQFIFSSNLPGIKVME